MPAPSPMRATGDAIGGASVLLSRRTPDGAPSAHSGLSDQRVRLLLPPVRAPRFVSSLRHDRSGIVKTVSLIAVTGTGEQRIPVALRQRNIALEEMTVEGERMTGATGSGLARGLFVRSIPGDPNEYILDGARVYNPAHFGGVLSSFHPEALNEIEVGRGGLPASFGGRIGGMLDLSLRDGMRDRVTGSAGSRPSRCSCSIGGTDR